MPALLGYLVTLLRIMLMAKIGAFVAKVLLFFGFTWATNSFAIGPAIDQIEAMMQSGTGGGGLGANVLAWAGVLRMDDAVSMILSAYSAAWTIKNAKVFLMKAD